MITHVVSIMVARWSSPSREAEGWEAMGWEAHDGREAIPEGAVRIPSPFCGDVVPSYGFTMIKREATPEA